MPDLMPQGFMVGNSFFNNFQGGPAGGAANAAVNTYTPRAANPVLPPLGPGQSGTASTSAQVGATSQSGTSSGTTRTVVPADWLGTANSGMTELMHEYDTSPAAFDTAAFDTASLARQQHDLSVGKATAENAAAEYINRTRQAGGVGAGAGLVKAQGILSAQDAAGKAEEDRTKFDIQQREAAATHAGQIASLLSNLRLGYLSSLAGKNTEDKQDQSGNTSSSGSQTSINQNAAAGGGGGGGSNWAGIIPNGMGRASGLEPFQVNSFTGQYSTPTSATNLTGPWNAARFGG